MKFLLVLLLSATLIFSLGAGCSKNSENDQATPIVTNQVIMKNSAFDPQIVTITRGSVVTWENQDATAHQVITDGDFPEFASGLIESNGSFSFTFENPGTYKYHCNIHPQMKGEVVVK